MGEKLIDRIGYVIFALLLSWLLYWAPQSIGVFGGNDNFAHWVLARYAWQYPELFLRMWGRPVYTFFFSFSAYGGIQGLKVMNTLLFGLTALLTADTAKLMGFKNTVWLAILTLSVPLMFEMSVSGMTEIPMALVVIGSLNLYYRQNGLWAAILISFAPFTRPEGWLFIAALGGLWTLQMQWKRIPWLLTGTLIMSLIGWGVYGSPIWFLEKNPYPMESPYGSGSFWTFVNHLPNSLNIIVFIGFVLGHFLLFIGTSKKEVLERFALIVAPFWLFVFAHSYMWYKGIVGSMGLTRVMVSVFPLALLMSWAAWNQLGRIRRPLGTLALAVLSVSMVIVVWSEYNFPKPEDGFTRFSRSVGHWYRDSEYAGHKLICDNQRLLYFTEKDPFKPGNVQRFFPKRYFPDINGNEEGLFILWDSRTASQRFPVERIMNESKYRLVKVFRPSTHSGQPGKFFEVYAFVKLDEPGTHSNYELAENEAVVQLIDL